MGISCEINFIDENPTREQAVLFEQLICSLRDSPTEFLIFQFRNPKNGPDRQQGLVFFQLCREGSKIHAEIRIDGSGETRMYAKQMEKADAVGHLRRMIRTRTAPDLAGWEDITEQAFAVPGDEEFE